MTAPKCPPDMDEVDLRDHRGRLTRLGIAAAIALAATAGVMRLIRATSPTTNADPVGASIGPLLAIAMFVVGTAAISGGLARVATWRRRRSR